jgi:hypothetical protein
VLRSTEKDRYLLLGDSLGVFVARITLLNLVNNQLSCQHGHVLFVAVESLRKKRAIQKQNQSKSHETRTYKQMYPI